MPNIHCQLVQTKLDIEVRIGVLDSTIMDLREAVDNIFSTRQKIKRIKNYICTEVVPRTQQRVASMLREKAEIYA
jgi:hypothetical protein